MRGREREDGLRQEEGDTSVTGFLITLQLEIAYGVEKEEDGAQGNHRGCCIGFCLRGCVSLPLATILTGGAGLSQRP